MKLYKVKPAHRGYSEVITEIEYDLLPRKMQGWYEELVDIGENEDTLDEAASKLAERGKEPDDFWLDNKRVDNE